jgi:phosphatidylglycerophosphate synthase
MPMKGRFVRRAALAIGIVLFLAALYYVNFDLAAGTIRRLGLALPLALFFSGLWHLVRTWAWSWCFPDRRRVPFLRLARVRLAAEAFSYLTLRGIAGEPLKVVLLADRVPAREATAAVALERIAYLVGTTLIIGFGSVAAMIGLPLTRIWFRIFRAFAITAAIVTVLTGFVITGRGTYLQSLLRRMDDAFGTTVSAGAVSRFVTAVEAQILDLVRGSPLRLAVLLAASVLSYLFMALEAWVILRASGAPITPNGALAVETFSRVASFASAFIPANLGALEASSLAAVAAVGAVGGGAALAIARRLRGLFWAGVGLAIYPRKVRPAHPTSDEPQTRQPSPPRTTLLYLPQHPAGGVPPTARLAGLPLVERVIRAATRANYTSIVVWTDGLPVQTRRALNRLAESIPGLVLADSDEWRQAVQATNGFRPVTVVGSGTVVSAALLSDAAAIVPPPGEAGDVPAGAAWSATGVLRLSAHEAADPRALARLLAASQSRVRELPSGQEISDGQARLALRIETAADLRAAEATIRRSTYKDTDNTVAQFNRRMSIPLSVALIQTPLTANQLSVALVAIGFYSAWLFSLGHYWTGVLAAFLSLCASVLDGCDGEIARLKYQESAIGCWIETVGDYSYYVAIFVGLTIGAVRQTRAEAFYWVGGLAVAGTLLSFALLIFLRTRITGGRPERLHSIARDRFTADPSLWARIIWRLSFTATRSAMPYGIFAFSLLNALPAIVVLAAIGSNVYWVSLVWKLRALLSEDAGQQLTASG